ncbi:hypothetical protein ACFC8N_42825 [Streptomyces sp. NPDC055966]|uniref:hypothetical protein n=1 Tax=Streptomyces sp. NPDC055966 TaxID=3345669 RepID=UPI0035E004AF
MNDEFPASNGDAVLAEADQYFLADPGAPVEPRPVAAGYLTRETLEAAFARLEHHELRADPMQVHSPASQTLTSADPEPPVGTIVRTAAGTLWSRYEDRPVAWEPADSDMREWADAESWTKVAGNYGPVTVIEWGEER